MNDYYDVTVVGGGPAGSVAALLAAKRGLRTALVDKATFPRDKVCGDGLSPGVIHLVSQLGLASIFDQDVPIQGVDVRGADGARLFGDLPSVNGSRVHGYVVQRADFDSRLHAKALAAGALDLSPCEFTDTSLDSGRRLVTVRTPSGAQSFHTGLLIGADGAYSRVRRALGVPMTGTHASGIAMRAYVETDLFDIGGPVGPRLMIEFGKELRPGYGWIFPTGQGVVNIGVGIAIRDLRGRGLNMRELFDRYTQLNEARGLHLGRWRDRRAHQLPQIGDMPRLAHPRAVLLGDAASMINPVTGEGIYYGIAAAASLAGVLPAPELLSADEKELTAILRRFERSFRSSHRSHIRSTQIAHFMLRHHRWASIVLTAAGRDPEVFKDALQLLFGAGRIKASTTARILRSGWRAGPA